MTAILVCLLLLPLVLTLHAAAPEGGKIGAFLEKKTFVGTRGGKLPYRLLKPDSSEPDKRYPLVVFLHGAGERGSDNERQLVHGVAEFVRPENRRNYPCFLLAPQCPTGQRWVDVDWNATRHKMPAQPARPTKLLMALIDELQREYPIDPYRLYLTGLSMGGYGTWDLLARYPKLFAAAVPICGGGDENQAATIATIPVWVFHGAKDDAVPVSRSRSMVAALKKAGGQPRYTEYRNEGHASWVPAYRDPALLEWLFAQRKE